MRGRGRNIGGAGADVGDMGGAVTGTLPGRREAVEAAAAAASAAAAPVSH